MYGCSHARDTHQRFGMGCSPHKAKLPTFRTPNYDDFKRSTTMQTSPFREEAQPSPARPFEVLATNPLWVLAMRQRADASCTSVAATLQAVPGRAGRADSQEQTLLTTRQGKRNRSGSVTMKSGLCCVWRGKILTSR